MGTKPEATQRHDTHLSVEGAVGRECVLEDALAGATWEVAHITAVLRPDEVHVVRVRPRAHHLLRLLNPSHQQTQLGGFSSAIYPLQDQEKVMDHNFSWKGPKFGLFFRFRYQRNVLFGLKFGVFRFTV